MNPSENKVVDTAVNVQQQNGGYYPQVQPQPVFVQYPYNLYPQLYNNNGNALNNNGGQQQLHVLQGGVQYPVIYQQGPMTTDNISANQPIITMDQNNQPIGSQQQLLEDGLQNVGSKCCKGSKCLMKFKEQFTKENAKKSINILSLCLLALVIVLFTYIGAYYYSRPPVWISILAAFGVVLGMVGQLARNHFIMLIYLIINVICFIFVCTALWSTRAGMCFGFLLISGIKAAEFTKVYYEEYKAKKSQQQQETTTMYDATTNQPTAVNTQNNVEGTEQIQQQ
ncbi:hypothetical protein ABK040_003912 [Willaertia magna]